MDLEETNSQFNRLSRRAVWIGVGAVVAMGVLYGGLWILLAAGLRDVATGWIDDQRAADWAIAMDEPRLHGFPGWPNVELTSVSVQAPLQDGGWHWRTGTVTLKPAAFDLTTLIIRAPGTHTLSAPWTAGETWTAIAGQAGFKLDLDTSGKWQGAQLALSRAELRDPFQRPLIGAERFHMEFVLTDSGASGEANGGDVFARFKGAADGIRLGLSMGPFARKVRAVRLEADLVGAIAPGRLPEALEAWRSGGGTLDVRRFLLDWPPLTITGDGTMALDNRLQPMGAFSTRITGFKETLRTLESGGVIPPGQAASAQIILGLLAKTPRGSDEPELSVPLSIQDQRLSVGPFDLMDLPDVRWD